MDLADSNTKHPMFLYMFYETLSWLQLTLMYRNIQTFFIINNLDHIKLPLLFWLCLNSQFYSIVLRCCSNAPFLCSLCKALPWTLHLLYTKVDFFIITLSIMNHVTTSPYIKKIKKNALSKETVNILDIRHAIIEMKTCQYLIKNTL